MGLNHGRGIRWLGKSFDKKRIILAALSVSELRIQVWGFGKKYFGPDDFQVNSDTFKSFDIRTDFRRSFSSLQFWLRELQNLWKLEISIQPQSAFQGFASNLKLGLDFPPIEISDSEKYPPALDWQSLCSSCQWRQTFFVRLIFLNKSLFQLLRRYLSQANYSAPTIISSFSGRISSIQFSFLKRALITPKVDSRHIKNYA